MQGERYSGMGGLCRRSFMAPAPRHTGFLDLFGVLFGQRVGGGCAAAGRRARGSRATALGVRGREGRPYDYVLSPYHHTLAVTPQPCGRHSG